MKFVSKVAAFSAAAALSATGLVAATGMTANAATVTKTYTCSGTVGGDTLPATAIPITFDAPRLPASLTPGSTVASLPVSGAASLANVATTAPSLVPVLAELPSITSSVPDFKPTLGGVALPFKLADQTVAPTDAIANGLKLSGNLTQPVKVPAAGSYSLNVPTAFTLNLSTGGQAVGTAKCTIPASSAKLATVTVADTLAVKAPKSVKAGHVLKLKVTTSATGKAIAKIKGKKVAKAAIKNGKATLKVKKGLKHGKNKIVVSVGKLKKTVKVTVK
jgi:hypothetical protein